MNMGTEKDIKPSHFNNGTKHYDFMIRKCTLEDLEGVIDVNEKELPEDYPYFFYKSILDNFPESFLIACKKNSPKKIIGYVMWRVEKIPSFNSLNLVNKAHLVSIAVSKSYRRKGVSAALLTQSMPAMKKNKIKEYVLEVRVSNYAAINLYKKFNFKIQSIKKRYYRDGENAYYMVRKAN